MAIVNDSWKLIYTIKENRSELFDLKKDPEELVDVAKSNPNVVKDLKEILFDRMGVIELDSKNLERLKSLGYIK